MGSSSHKDEIRGIIRRVKRISSPPAILARINSLCNNPKTCVADFERALSADQSLVVRLLRLVNSAFYGLPSRVDTISRAVLIVGFRGIRELLFASSLFNAFADAKSETAFNIEHFWQHSFACAVVSQLAAERAGNETPESFFIAGLLHDIGRMVLLESRADDYVKVLTSARSTGNTLLNSEREILGFTHAEVGQELAFAWKLPPSLASAIAHHHDPRSCGAPSAHVDVVHLANILVTAAKLGNSGDRFVPPLDPEAWERLGLTEDVIVQMLDTACEQFEEGISFVQSGLRAA